MDGETTADESASGSSQAAQTDASTQPLNDARRPQRLFAKVNVAMNLVKKRLSNKNYTMIGEFLSDAKMAQLLAAIRIIIRGRLNATIDTWPVRQPHDYRPDVRYAILKVVEENWDLFQVDDEAGALDINGEAWNRDECVLSELILPQFYED